MSDRRPRALIVRGGWEGHEPTQTTARVVPMLEGAGFDCAVEETLDAYADEAVTRDLDLIVQCWTMGSITKRQLGGLLSAVSSGTALCGWHGGLCDAFREATEYQFMTGGQWVAHPGGKIDYEVNLVQAKKTDPIITGIDDFRVHSEQYYLHVDPSNEVLATTTCLGSEEVPWVRGCVMPVVWRRTFGLGRVFYCSVGHDASDFDIPEVSEILRRGMLWASKVPMARSRAGEVQG